MTRPRFAVMFWLDQQIACVALVACPVLFLRLGARWRQVKTLDSAAFGVVQEELSALRVVRVFGREDHEQEHLIRHSDALIRSEADLRLQVLKRRRAQSFSK